jgi:hypothetical protein
MEALFDTVHIKPHGVPAGAQRKKEKRKKNTGFFRDPGHAQHGNPPWPSRPLPPKTVDKNERHGQGADAPSSAYEVSLLSGPAKHSPHWYTQHILPFESGAPSSKLAKPAAPDARDFLLTGAFDGLDDLVDDAGVGELQMVLASSMLDHPHACWVHHATTPQNTYSRRITELVLLACQNLPQDAAHNFARSRLGQVIDREDGLGRREGSNGLADLENEILLDLV